jgi:Fanconi-associated nuclease 1
MDAFVTRLSKPPSQLREQVRGDSPEKERPSKRAKRQGSPDSEGGLCPDHPQDISPREDFPDNEAAKTKYQTEEHPRITGIESALPPAAEGQEAVEQYKTMKSSQASAHDEDDTTETTQPLWVKGRSSIYVDAFNLALDTVLEEESHLFDGKETEVFKQWRGLNYEAQYLYALYALPQI